MFRKLAPGLALIALAAPTLFACNGGGGSDEEFVRELCEAATGLRTGVEQAVKDASTSTDPNRALELIADAVDEFVTAFDAADPPGDLKDWYEAATKELEQKVRTFREQKSLAALEGFNDSPVPDPPAAAKQRLQDTAKDVPQCNGVAFLKPN